MPTSTKRRRHLSSLLNTHYYNDGSTGAQYPYTTTNQETRDDTRTHDGPVPSWREKIRLGMYAGTNLVGTQWHRESKPFRAKWVRFSLIPRPNPDVWSAYYGLSGRIHIGFYTGQQRASLTAADNLAKVRAISDLRRAQTSFQGGVFVGELRETLRALRSPAKTLREGISDYFATLKKRKRGVRGTAIQRRHALKDILGNTWLEYAFGWVPLISDIDSAAETLANHMVLKETRVQRKRFFAEGNDVYAWPVPHPTEAFTAANGPCIVICDIRRKEEYNVKYFGMLNVENPYKIGWQRIGLDLSNWLPTAWELVPWSFLADYFTNIGDIINAATTLRSQVLWMMKTVHYQCQQSAEGWRMSPFIEGTGVAKSKGFVGLLPGKEVWTYKTINRSKYNGSLVPSFEFQIPGFGTKWINMAALAVTHKRLRPYY